MKKLWLLVIPILLCLLSCDSSLVEENYSERECPYVLKKHSAYMETYIGIECFYGLTCNVKASFGLVKEFSDECVISYEYKFVQDNKAQVIQRKRIDSDPTVNLILDSKDYVHFSLIDNKNVEKKYDLDLSGVIRSYTVHDDSIDVNVMKDCRIIVFTEPEETVFFGHSDFGDQFSFSVLESKVPKFRYDCLWNKQSSLKTDYLDIYAEIYWR